MALITRQMNLRCQCRPGFTLAEDGRSCEEKASGCQVSNGGCEQECFDQPDGGHICGCRDGFRLDANGRDCIGLSFWIPGCQPSSPSVSPIVISPITSCQMLQLLLLIYPRYVSIRSSRINMKRCPAWEIRALVIDCVWTTERINWVVIVTRDIHWKKTSHFIVRVL